MLKFIKDNNLAERGDRIGIAVSGGSDSMALLHCFNNFKERGHFNICAVHLEHGIRGEASRKDANFVARQCEKLGIPLYGESADVPEAARKRKISVELAGRQIREELFERIIAAGKADYIATAHHADDNAESVLMHILRGSGINGLAGIRVKKGFIIRPFLAVKKADILDYLSKHRIPFRDDETNKDNDYRRNYIRNVLLGSAKSVFGDVSGSLNRLSKFASEDNDFIEKETDKAFKRNVLIKANRAEIDIAGLLNAHNAVAARILMRTLKELGVSYDLEAKHIDALVHIAETRETGKAVYLLNDLRASIEYGKLIIGGKGEEFKPYQYFRSKSSESVPAVRAALPGRTELLNGDVLEARIIKNYDRKNADKFCECFDLDKLPKDCILRNIKYKDAFSQSPDDVIRPLGAPGSKKLKRYFSDKKIPERKRNKIPVLANDENIIWAIGYIISDNYKIDENTKNIIQLKYLRKEQQS